MASDCCGNCGTCAQNRWQAVTVLESPPDRSWASFGGFGLAVSCWPWCKRVPALVIPPGKSFDLKELLKHQDEVRIRTLDGLSITVKKTRRTKFGGSHVAGLLFSVNTHGVTIEGRRGSCERYFTAWKEINPSRQALFWKYSFESDNSFPFANRVLIVRSPDNHYIQPRRPRPAGLASFRG